MSVPQLRAPQTKKEPLASTLQGTSTTTSPVNLLNSITEPRSRWISAESMFHKRNEPPSCIPFGGPDLCVGSAVPEAIKI